MASEHNSTEIKYWIREIETRGSDAVASALVSKLGTPEADAIQMAMVEYHKVKDAQLIALKSRVAQQKAMLADTSAEDNRKASLIARAALAIAIVALILSVINFFR